MILPTKPGFVSSAITKPRETTEESNKFTPAMLAGPRAVGLMPQATSGAPTVLAYIEKMGSENEAGRRMHISAGFTLVA